MNQKIESSLAPKAIGPYSQAIRAGNTLYLSGQIGLHPEKGELENGLEAQTRRALSNIEQVLASGGMKLSDVVKTTVFLTDMAHFAAVNQIYQEYFTAPYPARSCVAVRELPKGALVEIECIAVREDEKA